MRKRSPTTSRRGWTISPQQADSWLGQAHEKLLAEDAAGVARLCERVLRYAPAQSPRAIPRGRRARCAIWNGRVIWSRTINAGRPCRKNAKNNLALLPDVRRTGILPETIITSPFDDIPRKKLTHL